MMDKPLDENEVIHFGLNILLGTQTNCWKEVLKELCAILLFRHDLCSKKSWDSHHTQGALQLRE